MSISALPDTARVWVFGATEPFTDAQRAAIDADLTGFVRTWAAHGSQLLAAHAVVDGAFIVVAVDENQQGASGCSIDAMVRHLAGLEASLEVTVLDGARIWYRDATGAVVSCERSEFQDRGASGAVNGETRVFDPTILSLGDLRGGRFERPASQSWHSRLLNPRGTPAST